MKRKKKNNGNNVTRVYEEGRLDCIKGLLVNDNPYDKNSIEHDVWEAGWESASTDYLKDEGC